MYMRFDTWNIRCLYRAGSLGVLLLRTFSVAVITPAPHAARRLPAVDPNVGNAPAIVTLGQDTFGLVALYFDNYTAEARDLEDV
jgi:hypothetical protein